MDDSDEKLGALEGQEREQVLAYVRGRWSQLAAADREARKDAIKFTAVINAGGAAAVLAFMGTVLKDRADLATSLSLRLSLLFFVVGVLFCAFAYFVTHLRLRGLFEQWRKDVGRFYADEVDFTTMRKDDVERSEEPDGAIFCICIALSCFGLALLLGLNLFF